MDIVVRCNDFAKIFESNNIPVNEAKRSLRKITGAKSVEKFFTKGPNNYYIPEEEAGHILASLSLYDDMCMLPMYVRHYYDDKFIPYEEYYAYIKAEDVLPHVLKYFESKDIVPAVGAKLLNDALPKTLGLQGYTKLLQGQSTRKYIGYDVADALFCYIGDTARLMECEVITRQEYNKNRPSPPPGFKKKN